MVGEDNTRLSVLHLIFTRINVNTMDLEALNLSSANFIKNNYENFFRKDINYVFIRLVRKKNSIVDFFLMPCYDSDLQSCYISLATMESLAVGNLTNRSMIDSARKTMKLRHSCF